MREGEGIKMRTVKRLSYGRAFAWRSVDERRDIDKRPGCIYFVLVFCLLVSLM